MVYSDYKQHRILYYYNQGKKAPKICYLLIKERNSLVEVVYPIS